VRELPGHCWGTFGRTRQELPIAWARLGLVGKLMVGRWRLLTSGGDTAEWAERVVGWHETRGAIEEYFRLLRTGTRIKGRRLRLADVLVKCPAFDAITAWQVFSLARPARETPAEDLLNEDEREMIGAFVQRRQLRPPATEF